MNRRTSEEHSQTEKPRILIAGDAQAHGVAMALAKLPAISDAYAVVFCDAGTDAAAELTKDERRQCAFVLEQLGEKNLTGRFPRQCKQVTFPPLRLNLLWPLAARNPYNRAEPGDPTGPYPIGNSFILSSVEQGVPADQILQLFTREKWNEGWPDLDLLFKAETAALLGADAKSDVKMGSFVLKHFRKRRLFWAPAAPSNELLCELVFRILHACFGRQTPVDRTAIQNAFAQMSARDVMSHVAIPVHPAVASHFGLEWYDPDERYPSLQGTRSFEEYYRGMIDYVRSRISERRNSAAAQG